jgi:hypothetical protein
MKWMSLPAVIALTFATSGCGCCSCFRRSEPAPVPVAPYCPPAAPVCDPCATGPGVPPASAYSVGGSTTFSTVPPATTITPPPQL